MPIKLKSNKIGAKGAEMIAEALITNNVLTTLDLAVRFGIETKPLSTSINILKQGNEIGTQGAEKLATLLAGNRALTTLDIGVRLISTKSMWSKIDPCCHICSAIKLAHKQRRRFRWH